MMNYIPQARCKKCGVLVARDAVMESGQCVACWRKWFDVNGMHSKG
jgi:predicted Zn-ribbon and HTH transcriptional regulator